MIQQCYFPRSHRHHLWQPFWYWLRSSTGICNRFSFIATVSARKNQRNIRQKKILQDVTEPCISLVWNQLKISREIEISHWAWTRARLRRENEASISMETSNHKDREAPSLYVLEIKTRVLFECLSLVKVLIPWQKIQKEVQHRKAEVTTTKDYTVTLWSV